MFLCFTDLFYLFDKRALILGFGWYFQIVLYLCNSFFMCFFKNSYRTAMDLNNLLL